MASGNKPPKKSKKPVKAKDKKKGTTSGSGSGSSSTTNLRGGTKNVIPPKKDTKPTGDDKKSVGTGTGTATGTGTGVPTGLPAAGVGEAASGLAKWGVLGGSVLTGMGITKLGDVLSAITRPNPRAPAPQTPAQGKQGEEEPKKEEEGGGEGEPEMQDTPNPNAGTNPQTAPVTPTNQPNNLDQNEVDYARGLKMANGTMGKRPDQMSAAEYDEYINRSLLNPKSQFAQLARRHQEGLYRKSTGRYSANQQDLDEWGGDDSAENNTFKMYKEGLVNRSNLPDRLLYGKDGVMNPRQASLVRGNQPMLERKRLLNSGDLAPNASFGAASMPVNNQTRALAGLVANVNGPVPFNGAFNRPVMGSNGPIDARALMGQANSMMGGMQGGGITNDLRYPDTANVPAQLPADASVNDVLSNAGAYRSLNTTPKPINIKKPSNMDYEPYRLGNVPQGGVLKRR